MPAGGQSGKGTRNPARKLAGSCMPTDSSSAVTLVLQAAVGGGREAAKLLPLVYEELRKLARARMASSSSPMATSNWSSRSQNLLPARPAA